MDSRFLPHNTHVKGLEHYWQVDPQLSQLANQPYRYDFPMVHALPVGQPGIYTVGGGRQIGKTTLLKQWVAHLIAHHGLSARQIVFVTGEIIDDHHHLISLLTDVLQGMDPSTTSYVIVDEVTYIRDWDKAVKFLADSGQLRSTVLVLTGSELTMIREARMRFPGRRGAQAQTDFHLYPLSFRAYLSLVELLPELNDGLIEPEQCTEVFWQKLYQAFDQYLLHGGYLTAINDVAKHKLIMPNTLQTYSDWIRGDVLKRNKQETYLKEILMAIIKHYGSQISWNVLAQSLSVDHHKTVSDYIALLADMDATFIQYALLEDKLVAAPKKARKVWFCDPFIYHATHHWLCPGQADMTTILQDTQCVSGLVETAVISHFRRQYDTYYIKAAGEVDVAFIKDQTFWPIEIKWTNQLRPKELKQIQKYKNGEVWCKQPHFSHIQHLPLKPLPWVLANMEID